MRKIIFTFLALFIFFIPIKAQFSFDVPGQFVVDFGLNRLNETPKGMELKTWGSRSITFYYMYEVQLWNEKFTLHPGIGIASDKYSFKEDITVLRTDGNGQINILPLSNSDLRKSWLATDYIDIPLEFRFRTNPGRNAFRLAVGGKVGVLYATRTKLKFKDEGNDEMIKVKEKNDYGVNRWRYGLIGRIGLGPVNLFGFYSMNELFESSALQSIDSSVRPQTFTLGITLTAL
jgi:hypothetical protein